MKRLFSTAVVMTILAIIGATTAFAQNKTGKDLQDAVKRVDAASAVMNEIMTMRDKSIPRDLIEKAKAVVVFPGVIKGAFIVCGQRSARADTAA